MLKTFWIAFKLKITYRVNTIIYSLKQLPLIKRILPASLYASNILKRIAYVISMLWEIIEIFLYKGLYLGIFLIVPIMLARIDISLQPTFFVHILLFLTIAGAVSNNRLFDPSRDKYYAIILMKMDATKYTVTNYLYELLKIVIGFLGFLIYANIVFDFPLYLCLLAPLALCGAKIISGCYSLYQYKAKGKIRNENSPVKAVWTTIGICWLLAYLPFITGFVLPLSVGIIILIIMSLGICGFSYIYHFSLYRPMYQVLLGQKFSAINVSIKQITNDTYLKSISSDASITSKKKGYAYFNELFVKRHQKLLWRSAKRITVFALGLLIAAIIALLSFPNTHPQMNKMLLNFLPYFVFIIYSFNSGKSVVQAMFRNCDHSMLTYSFYRRKDVIISLFYLRLCDVICINLMPASIIAIGLPILLYITDKNTDPWIYLIVFICIIATSIFFSIHYLTCYYLLQPYNSMTETKSSTYNVIMSLTYLICFAFIYLRMNAFVFGLIMIAFCVIYIIIASILVYRYASKTFRLRQ